MTRFDCTHWIWWVRHPFANLRRVYDNRRWRNAECEDNDRWSRRA